MFAKCVCVYQWYLQQELGGGIGGGHCRGHCRADAVQLLDLAAPHLGQPLSVPLHTSAPRPRAVHTEAQLCALGQGSVSTHTHAHTHRYLHGYYQGIKPVCPNKITNELISNRSE